MTTVQELYELWTRTGELDALTGESLRPRGREWLFERFATLGPQPRQVVLDVGARDGRHIVRLVREHDLHGIAVDPVPHHVAAAHEAADDLDVEVVQGVVEELPVADASVDWIWCRDMLVHTDVERALEECARVLRAAGRMLAYVTLGTELLEPREEAWLRETCALTTLDGARVEAAAAAAGFETEEKVVLGPEWREQTLESGEFDANDALLRLARLRRLGIESSDAEAYAADKVWPVYQLLGKLCPTVYVWRRRG